MDFSIGVDIGTTQTKAVAFDLNGRAMESSYQRYPLYQDAEGMAEQDQTEILQAVIFTVREVVQKLSEHTLKFISFSSAMHSLLVLDQSKQALTRMITWADNRAQGESERLKNTPFGKKLYEETGMPNHPMAPFYKISWLKKQHPEVYRTASLFLGIKEYLFYTLFGEAICDYGCASGTGYFDIHRLEWSQTALNYLGVHASNLPKIVPPTYVKTGLKEEYAQLMGIAEETPFVIGGADGPLSNLGVGAIGRGEIALTVGTSGAIRMIVDHPILHPKEETFCYVLDEKHWVIGGATSNGAGAFDWACHTFLQETVHQAIKEKRSPYDAVLDEISSIPAGSSGIVFHPYLLGERAPLWESKASGSFVGLRREHTEKEMVHSVIEGICFNLKIILEDVIQKDDKITKIIATGGFAESLLFRQIMGDVLGVPLHFLENEEASALGAVILGWHALEKTQTLDEISSRLKKSTHSVVPDEHNRKKYEQVYPIFLHTQQLLAQSYKELATLN